MRKQILGLTSLAVIAAGTAAVGLAGAPAQAVAGYDAGNISGTGALPTDVDVVATGDGDAVAAWVRPVVGGVRVYAAHATDGDWSAPVNVTPAPVTSAEDLHLAASTKGDVVAVWTQVVNGEERVRGSRYLGGGTWDGSATLSTHTTTAIGETAVGMDDAGRVHVAVAAEIDATDPLLAAMWPKGGAPQFTQIDSYGAEPSLDVAPDGAVLVGYKGLHQGESAIEVSRRTATSSWSAPDAASWPDNAFSVDVGIADDGAGTVVFVGKDGADNRVVSSKVSTSGTVGGPDIVSLAGWTASKPAVHVSPDGTAIASWADFDGEDYRLLSAVRPPTAGFGAPGVVQAGTVSSTDSEPFLTGTGRQAVVHDDGGQLTFRYRTSPLLPAGTYAAGPADDGLFAADADRRGNVVAVGVSAAGNSSFVQADHLDMGGPVATVTGPGPQVVSTSVPVTWTATDTIAGVKNTDVIVSSAPWNSGTFSNPTVVGDNQLASPYGFKGSFGRTYCFEVQSVDNANNLGARSAKRCTAVPLDDLSLKGSGWNRKKKSGHFNGTLTFTSTKGKVLTRTGVRARRLVLVAAKAPNGGKVQVTWNGKSIGTISLKGTAAKKKAIGIETFSKVRVGTVKIKVVSASGRPVHIDGLVVSK
ncbi:hypothetical protein [Nocardioides sp. SYSU DS0651]|uniref:hypothetical protein n=1 Tax=Nocardioides sp. SYSU DS0651 TaxID=3415955 RepID=UPI003F4C75E5